MCGIEKYKDFGDQQQSTQQQGRQREQKKSRDAETFTKNVRTIDEKITKNSLKTAKIPVKWHRL
jgi:hypothetical protein